MLSSILTERKAVYIDMNFLTFEQAESIFDKVILKFGRKNTKIGTQYFRSEEKNVS